VLANITYNDKNTAENQQPQTPLSEITALPGPLAGFRSSQSFAAGKEKSGGVYEREEGRNPDISVDVTYPLRRVEQCWPCN